MKSLKTKDQSEQAATKNPSRDPFKVSYQIGETSRGHFDWPNVQEVFKKAQEEMGELKESFDLSKSEQVHELGDALFTLVQIARHLKISPHLALDLCNQRHNLRVQKMQDLVLADQKDYTQVSLNDLEAYWTQAKKALKAQESQSIKKALASTD